MFAQAELPTSWVQVHRRFDHAVKRAGLRIRVRLLPIEELPERADVLVVPPAFAATAAELVPDLRIVVATREDAAAAAAALVREIGEGVTLTAERATGNEPLVVTHRGPRVL